MEEFWHFMETQMLDGLFFDHWYNDGDLRYCIPECKYVATFLAVAFLEMKYTKVHNKMLQAENSCQQW